MASPTFAFFCTLNTTASGLQVASTRRVARYTSKRLWDRYHMTRVNACGDGWNTLARMLGIGPAE